MNKELEEAIKRLKAIKNAKLDSDSEIALFEFAENDRYIDLILNYIEMLEEKYNDLVRISIETAFEEENKDTEFLLRCLLKQKKVDFDNKKQKYINPQQNKEFMVMGIKFDKDKAFLIENDRLDEYTKQIEYKLENSISKEVIEKKIENLESQYKEALEENSTQAFILKCQIEILKELLKEGK